MTPKNRPWRFIFTNLPRALTIVVGLAIVAALFSSMPQTTLTLEAGTNGGLFDVLSHQLADALKPHGIDVKIVNRPDSLKIADDIVDPSSPVEAGFIASDTPKEEYGLIKQMGTVMLAPVYLISHKESNIDEITHFAGKKISLYPVGSAAWSACEYILGSYGITIDAANSQYGNGPTIIENVEKGISEVGCFIDVPSGTSMKYADDIMEALSNESLRFIEIPQAMAIQARKDFLRPLTIPSGAFHVHPPRPSTDISTTGASLTFVAKKDLPRELITVISHFLSEEYKGSTSANFAGELPATNYTNLPVFSKSRDVYSGGLPWMYERFSFGTAAFIDKFIHQYGVALTILFLILSVIDLFGLPLPYQLVEGSRPRRMQMMMNHLQKQIEQNGELSKRDQKKLSKFQKWLEKESSGIDGLEDQVRTIRSQLSKDA